MTVSPRSPVVAVVQARMLSKRLPGKVLKVAAGKTLLAWHITRLSRARLIDRIVVATSHGPADDLVVAACAELGVACARGPEQDVLERYRLAAEAADAVTVIRTTADCPLIDPVLVDEAVAAFAADPACDYLTLDSAVLPNGLSAEVFPRAVLDQVAAEAVEAFEREHVTPFIYMHPERFRLARLDPAGDPAFSRHRWSVDEPADFVLIEHLLQALGGRPDFGWRDVLALFDSHPEWMEINAQVRQKGAHEAETAVIPVQAC